MCAVMRKNMLLFAPRLNDEDCPELRAGPELVFPPSGPGALPSWASPVAAPAPRAAKPPPRRRALPRIFVVQCGLPCDPPGGGHSCNGGIIPRFHRAVEKRPLASASRISQGQIKLFSKTLPQPPA